MTNGKFEPPQFWISFLQWFCPPNLYEGIAGDLLEQFDSEVKTAGLRRARRRFIWHVIRFFRPGILLRHRFSFSVKDLLSPFDLTKIYVQVAWRNLIRHRAVSLIKVVGLSVSLSVGLLILLVVKNRLDFDTFHPDSDRLYRITTKVQEKSDERTHFATTPPALGPFLKEHFAFAEDVLRVMPTLAGNVVSAGGEIFVSGAYVDDSFFRLLGFKLIAGNPTHALAEPNSIVLTEETAQKVFGRDMPLGKILTLQGYGDFKVTGIIGPPDGPSEIEFGAYASLSTVMQADRSQTVPMVEDWNSLYTTYTYVRIHAGTDDVMSSALREVSRQISSRTDVERTYVFQANNIDEIPFSDVYLSHGHSVQSLMILSLPGVILLLLAIFNYTNMTFARAFSRSKELGVRKINGAPRVQLFFQLIVESVLVAIIATILAGFIATQIPVNESFQRALPKTIDASVIVWFFLFSIVAGFLAGAVPAWVLSGVKPVQALKNAGKISKITWRKSLIVVQYTLSLAFLIVLLVNYKQMQFQITSDYGFDREGIIHIKSGTANPHLLMTKFESIPGVERISASSNPIFTWGNICSMASEHDSARVEYYSVDDEYLSVYGLSLVAGQNLTPARHEQYILLNEAAVEVLKLGSPSEALGQSVIIDDTLSLQVRGVVKDFNAHPFKFAITPMALRYKPDEFNVLTVKTYPSGLPRALKRISAAWSQLEPDHPLSYTVFADSFNEKQAHKQDLEMMSSVAVLSIVISCLGLLGVVMYSTHMRMKEIGIRKTMGAFPHQIMVLISWTFLRLLLIAACLAIPLGYWFGELLLQQFAYRIELGAGIGFLGFVIMMGVSLLTIGSQTIGAALRNPVEILRYE